MASVNLDKKIIYLHIPKTAGSYIQQILLKNYGFFVYNWMALDYQKCVFSYKGCTLSDYFSTPEILEIIGITSLSEYKKFTFVRNPYHRFISAWKYMVQKGFLNENMSIDEIIDNRENFSGIVYNHLFVTQSDHLSKWHFDEIGKFETLEEDLECILNEFDIIKTHKPIKYNVTNNYGDSMEFYNTNPKLLQFVNTYFAEDFTKFGYSTI